MEDGGRKKRGKKKQSSNHYLTSAMRLSTAVAGCWQARRPRRRTILLASSPFYRTLPDLPVNIPKLLEPCARSTVGRLQHLIQNAECCFWCYGGGRFIFMSLFLFYFPSTTTAIGATDGSGTMARRGPDGDPAAYDHELR